VIVASRAGARGSGNSRPVGDPADQVRRDLHVSVGFGEELSSLAGAVGVAGASLIRVANVPANAAAGVLTRPVPPIAASRPHTNVFGQRPHEGMSCHIPARMSPACRDGIITALMVRECPSAITSTGRTRADPSPTGIFVAGNHRSHCSISPGLYSVRSTGSTPR
jgi:hypothetical protein